MSRIHAITAGLAAIEAHFGASAGGDLEIPIETVEGCPGIVVIEREGRRLVRAMRWGFPRLTAEMRERGEDATPLGLVADLTNPMWDKTAADPRYRCLIVLTHFAEPDGEDRKRTRTWFSAEGTPPLAWAGFCRNSREWGPAYAGMTMDANSAVSPLNERMPVLLAPHDYDRWLHGDIRTVIGFQFGTPFPSDRLVMQQTEDRWNSGAGPPRDAPQLALL